MINFSTVKSIIIPQGNVAGVTVGELKLWTSVEPSEPNILPDGYTKLSYIQTDGSSWINTEINPSLYATGLEYTFKGRRLAQNNTNDYLWGCLADGKRSGNVTINSGLGYTVLYLSSTGTALKKAPVPALNTDFEIYVKATPKDAANAVFKYNGTSFANEFAPSNSDMPNANIYLCYCPNVGSTSKPFIGRVYSFIINVTDGTPLRNFVPAQRNSDNVVGMYDMVSGAFFTNAGTGSFVAGTEA